MKVKWSVIVLVLLGVAAAFSAAVFTASLSAQQLRDAVDFSAPEVEILVAAGPIETNARVEESFITTKNVSLDDAPLGFVTEPTQLIGKITTVPVIEGQPFTLALFPPEGTGTHLASILPPGKRAVNISLADYEGLDGLLYPGSYVDVMASFKVRVNSKMGTAVSTTLLQNIQVLAVENLTVGTAQEETDDNANRLNGMPKRPLVTLLVDTKQAEALQLAMKHGAISLAMRNPSDNEIVETDATLLSDGVLAALAGVLPPGVLSAGEEGTMKLAQADDSPEDAAPLEKPVEVQAAPAAPKAQMKSVTVMRGLRSDSISFPVDAN